MNAKQKRTLLILLVAAALLAAAVLAARGAKSRARQRAEDAAAAAASSGVLTDAATSYKALSYYNGSATMSFALNDEGKWYWTDDAGFPLDQDRLAKMVDTLSSLKPQQTITDGDTLDAYGLSAPAQTLTATAENGQITTLALGKATTDGNSYYMLMNGSETPVYIISDELAKEMAVGIYDMCLLPDLPALTEDRLTGVTLAGAATTVLTASHEPAQSGADGSSGSSSSGGETSVTAWRCGGADVTGDKQVQSAVKQLLDLSLDACVDYRPSKGAASLCGFDKPDAVITVSYAGDGNADKALVLTVGGQVVNGDGRYVRVGDDTTVYRMAADKLDALMKLCANGLDAGSSPAG